MSSLSVPVAAGFASTAIFASSTLPMLGKAVRTRDLSSYSLGNLLLASVGNGVHSLYVFSLPAGPVWLLHTLNLASTAAMLGWFLRYEGVPRRGPARDAASIRDAPDRRPDPRPDHRSGRRRTPSAPTPRRRPSGCRP